MVSTDIWDQVSARNTLSQDVSLDALQRTFVYLITKKIQ